MCKKRCDCGLDFLTDNDEEELCLFCREEVQLMNGRKARGRGRPRVRPTKKIRGDNTTLVEMTHASSKEWARQKDAMPLLQQS